MILTQDLYLIIRVMKTTPKRLLDVELLKALALPHERVQGRKALGIQVNLRGDKCKGWELAVQDKANS